MRRYRQIAPVVQRGYPAFVLDVFRERPPDLLRRKYWTSRLSFERKHWPHVWW